MAGAFVTDTVDAQTRTVYNFPDGAGLAATTTGLVSPDNYSVVVLAKFNVVQNITKLLDFKSFSSDAGLYVASGLLSFYDGAANVTNSGGSLVVNEYAQIVLTRDGATDQVTAYTNGVQAFTFTDTGDLGVIDDPGFAAETLNFFLDDGLLTPINENSAGNVARLRLYEGALSTTQVAALDRLPGAVPAPAALPVFALG